MPCYTPLKGYKDITTGGLTFDKKNSHSPLEVSCGSCLGCRIDHSIVWAIRIVHESAMHEHNCWLTLTYRDQYDCTPEQYKNGHHVPPKHELVPSHVTKFIRALRKANPATPIKYFFAGEYGDENQRPHYHVCIFGKSFTDQALWQDDQGKYTFTSPTLDKLWKFGFSTIQELCFENAKYTAQYSLKKITGKRAFDHYLRCDEHGEAYWLPPEFIRMSTGNTLGKHQGIGASFYEKFQSDIFPSDTTPVPGHGNSQYVPRYYQNILESTNPDTLELVKSLRKTFMDAHKADFTPERLRDKYHCARARQSNQMRTL